MIYSFSFPPFMQNFYDSGERKRVNIGTELLTNPSIIMLDEPTSGLDSTSAVALMSLLVSLAHDHGKTVITSIHQPSSAVFHKFDKVLFLADGCVVYHGSPADSLLYCKQLGYECPDGYNSADHWMDLLVEDSAIPTNSEKVTSEEDYGIGASFPIKINGEDQDDVEKNIYKKVDTGDEKKKLIGMLGSRRFSSIGRLSGISRFSSITLASNKGFHILDACKVKRDEYKSLKTPKARLINVWDVDNWAERIEEEIAQNMNGSVHSVGSETREVEGVEEKKFNTSWSTQFYILLHRSLKTSSAAIWTPINFFKSIALAVLTGLLWFQVPHTEAALPDRHSFIFFSITYWIFDGTFTAIFTFPNERAIIFKERASGSYYLSAYFLSKTISEMPTRLSLPCIFWTIAYWMSGVNYRFDVFLGTMGCTLLAVLAGESYGLLCGALVMDFEKVCIMYHVRYRFKVPSLIIVYIC